jgi:hypothetical protein
LPGCGFYTIKSTKEKPMKDKASFAIMFLFLVLLGAPAWAANHYIRAGASGTNNGSDWINAFSDLPITLGRGDTYYIADGSYATYTFDDTPNGDQYITIKKATLENHGTDIGWIDSYGDGQAILGDLITFESDYYIIDGNGAKVIPSDNTLDYGFKVSHDSSTNWGGIIRFGIYGKTVSNITLRYLHVYNTTNGDINNGTVSLRFMYVDNPAYIKIQNCFIENSGKDGLQLSGADNVLVERCYLKRLGKLHSPPPLPDVHGQTVQMFYGSDNVIFRYNYWEANEGQALISYGGTQYPNSNLRFYGNVVFIKYGQTDATPGFNSSGGIIGNAWPSPGISNILIYNNTMVNIGGDYGGAARFPIYSSTPVENCHLYNNLIYNNENTGFTNYWTGNGYHASGGGDSAGGVNEQLNISPSIFKNYQQNNFILEASTDPAKDLTEEEWWNDDPDPFFGQLDDSRDLLNHKRGTDGNWDRGAYEYIPAQPQTWTLNAGWNWISFNVLPADLSLNSVFNGILAQVEQVKGQTQSAICSNGNWKGDLANMNGIGQYKMFKVKVSAARTLTVTGTAIAAATSIPLVTGWNWVAYLPNTAMPITTALASINGQVQEVKSLTQSAAYSGGAWSGTLTTLNPGQGYAIKMSAPGTLTYPVAAATQANQQRRTQ